METSWTYSPITTKYTSNESMKYYFKVPEKIKNTQEYLQQRCQRP